MTDRIFSYTVTLDREIREDDAEAITNAIRMIKGVTEVIPLVADPTLHWAEMRARRELIDKIWAVLKTGA
jgi:hypothetical protein